MPYYTEKQIEQARSIDLLTYLQTYEPTELVHVRGNTYCTREHDSLKISNGKWMWWSKGFGGKSALDYLIKVKGMQFMDAMKILSGEKDNTPHSSTERSEKTDRDVKRTLLLPERNENEMTIIWYLVGRGVDYDIIKDCIDNGLIFESEVYHNCVFLGLDENGKAAYASFRSSRDDSRFKGEAVGSDKRYSFRIEAKSNTYCSTYRCPTRQECIDKADEFLTGQAKLAQGLDINATIVDILKKKYEYDYKKNYLGEAGYGRNLDSLKMLEIASVK